MAVGDGEKANCERNIENEENTGMVSPVEQRKCLKSLLQTPLSKGETW